MHQRWLIRRGCFSAGRSTLSSKISSRGCLAEVVSVLAASPGLHRSHHYDHYRFASQGLVWAVPLCGRPERAGSGGSGSAFSCGQADLHSAGWHTFSWIKSRGGRVVEGLGFSIVPRTRALGISMDSLRRLVVWIDGDCEAEGLGVSSDPRTRAWCISMGWPRWLVVWFNTAGD